MVNLQYNTTVQWKTAYEVCEMKKMLEEEDASKNKELGRYVQVHSVSEEGVFCLTGTKRIEKIISTFEVRTMQWPGLKKAFVDAGYSVLVPFKLLK